MPKINRICFYSLLKNPVNFCQLSLTYCRHIHSALYPFLYNFACPIVLVWVHAHYNLILKENCPQIWYMYSMIFLMIEAWVFLNFSQNTCHDNLAFALYCALALNISIWSVAICETHFSTNFDIIKRVKCNEITLRCAN